MQPHEAGPTNGRRLSSTGRVGAGSERDGLQATCRRQAYVIEALNEAVSVWRSGAAAPKAENADLRAANERVRDRGGGRAHASNRTREALEASLGLAARAPAAARIVVADHLRGRVAASVLANAQVVMSELVTNSVCHSGAAADGIVTVRVRLTGTMIRLEVEDRGCGMIALRSPDLASGGGFGLQIVQALSERWGLECSVAGRARVWAQLARAPLVAPVPAESSNIHGARSSPNEMLSSGRAAVTRRREPAGGAP